MKLMLGKRLKAAWDAFLLPDDVFFRSIDTIIGREFPDMPTEFRQRGHTTMVIKEIHRNRPSFLR